MVDETLGLSNPFAKMNAMPYATANSTDALIITGDRHERK
jgi:hypothetical protein